MVWSSLELLEIFLENKGKNKKCTKEKLHHLSQKNNWRLSNYVVQIQVVIGM